MQIELQLDVRKFHHMHWRQSNRKVEPRQIYALFFVKFMEIFFLIIASSVEMDMPFDSVVPCAMISSYHCIASLEPGHVENWLAPGGGHGCRLKEGGGGLGNGHL